MFGLVNHGSKGLIVANDLKERLLKTEGAPDFPGVQRVSTFSYRNPDGPAAVAEIRRLTTDLAEYRKSEEHWAALLEKAREALEPFAKAIELIDDDDDNDYAPGWSAFIEVKHYRTAHETWRELGVGE